MKNLFDKVKKEKVFWLVFACVLVMGIFLRTYNFHDWLRFSMDQSRDAAIIGNVIEGKSPLFLLGPLAGGTDFYLGPAYYYFSYVSAKIFGNYPDKMAYPSLIFSVLAIPFLFFFLKEYFSRNISLMLMAIMSISHFAVASSRFSSNPNLVPFFVLLFLFSFLKILNRERREWLWFLFVGLSLGIGVQLHTTLLIILPIFTIIVFAYLFKTQGKKIAKGLVVVFLVSLILNSTQILHEIRTNGGNSKAFMSGFEIKGTSEDTFVEKIASISSCQIKANSNIISSLPIIEDCSKGFDLRWGAGKQFENIEDKQLRKGIFLANFSFSVAFSVLGYILLGYYLRKESERKSKNFLGLILAFNVISLVFLLPIMAYISVNYFIILFFIPFVIFGLILKFVEEKFGKILLTTIFILFLIPSFFADKAAAYEYMNGLDNDTENCDLKMIESISSYMLKDASVVTYLSGKKAYVERFSGSVKYFFEKEGKNLYVIRADDARNPEYEMENFFYIQKSSEEDINKKSSIEDYHVLDGRRFYNIDVYLLKK